MKKAIILIIFILPYLISSQIVKEGKTFQLKHSEFFIIEENENYAITFCPENIRLNNLVSRLILNFNFDPNYKNEFKLIKHDLTSLKPQEFVYNCLKKSVIVEYKNIDGKFIIISKFTKNNIEHFYADVIDLISMKKIISKKEIIRFENGNQHIVYYLKKKDANKIQLLIKQVTNNSTKETFQYFILNSNFKIINHQKISVDQLFHNCHVLLKSNKESSTLFLTANTKKSETKVKKPIYGIVDIFHDHYNFSKLEGHSFTIAENSKVLGKDKSNLIVSLVKSRGYELANRINIINLNTATIEYVNFPKKVYNEFKESGNNYNQVNFKKICDSIYSVESYKDVYNTERGWQRHYGPIILFKTSHNAEISWSKVIIRDSFFKLNGRLKEKVKWINSKKSISFVVQESSKYLSLYKVNKSNGEIGPSKKIELKKMKYLYLSQKVSKSDKETQFFMLQYYKGLYSNKLKSLPILIKL